MFIYSRHYYNDILSSEELLADFKTRNTLKLYTLYTTMVSNVCLPHHPSPSRVSNLGPMAPEAIAVPLSYRPLFTVVLHLNQYKSVIIGIEGVGFTASWSSG